MKYLGQWEERLERVIDELARIPGVLCVDRLLDLVRTGGHSSLAAFLMPYLQRGELRMAGEATPAELDACRRLLPGFADLFPVLTLPPFDRTQALAVLDRTAEQHARNLRVEVASGVSDRIYHLFRRFAPYQSFPGPAAGFVRELCERQARAAPKLPVTPDDVVNQFVRRTGLPRWLLRDEEAMDPESLLVGAAVAGDRPGGRGAVGGAAHSDVQGGAERPEPADWRTALLRPHRRRQDGTGPRPGGALFRSLRRRRGRPRPARPLAARRLAPGAPGHERVRRLRRGATAGRAAGRRAERASSAA